MECLSLGCTQIKPSAHSVDACVRPPWVCPTPVRALGQSRAQLGVRTRRPRGPALERNASNAQLGPLQLPPGILRGWGNYKRLTLTCSTPEPSVLKLTAAARGAGQSGPREQPPCSHTHLHAHVRNVTPMSMSVSPSASPPSDPRTAQVCAMAPFPSPQNPTPPKISLGTPVHLLTFAYPP